MEEPNAPGGLDENPFSFKHFLKNHSEDVTSINNSVTINHEVSDQPKQLTDEIPFPDVHQDQNDLILTKKKGKGKKVKEAANKKQDVPGHESDNPFSFKNFVKKDAALKTSGRVLQIIDDEVHEIESNKKIPDDQDPDTDIPKPLSDKQGFHESEILLNTPITDGQILSSADEGSDAFTKIMSENKKLRRELKETKQLKEDESKRVASLLKKLEEIKEKENEETAALEKMVHMVEKNLDLTTQRAVKVEAMNAKLREENKQLKINSVSRAAYDDLVSQHHSLLASIKDQASSAAQHLEATATKAEESLKQLYSGVDSFRLVAQLLSSIDKFTTVNHDQET